MLLLILTLLPHIISSSSSSPNIIFIFADDLGSADVGFMGSDIRTPSIDLLALSGVILNQHYVQPMCSPSRASFITGRYPIHTGFQNGNIQQGELWGLGLHEFTIAEMFKEYGYATHAIGKWHLGWRTWRHTPVRRGFDSYLGFYFCAHDHFEYECGGLVSSKVKSKELKNIIRTFRKRKRKLRKEYKWLELDHPANPLPRIKPRYFDLRENWLDANGNLVDKIRYDLKGQYSANVFTKQAVDKIKKRGDKPFFIYLNYMNVHGPFQAPQHYVDKYTKHMNGATHDRTMYAAMMSSIDEGIGNITKTLITEGIYNNTIIVFTSDNGAKVGDCNSTDDNKKVAPFPGSNYPLRGGKRSVFEGGIRAVAFVHSPLVKKRSRVIDDLIHVVDWFATFEDIISDGYSTKPMYGTRNRTNTDSISAWKTIRKGARGSRTKFLINIDERGGINCGPEAPFKAIRKNQWKLIVGGGGPPSGWYSPHSDPVQSTTQLPYLQLYNVIRDPTERFNMAASFPGVVINLLQELEDYKKTMVPSLRKNKKYGLVPFLINNVPTPLSLSDKQCNEEYYDEPYRNMGIVV